MSAVWKTQTGKVAAAVQTAARRGPGWATRLTREAAACGMAETLCPEAVRGLIRTAVVLLEHRLSEAEASRDDCRNRLADLPSLRFERDEAAKDLYDTVVRVRGLASCAFGRSFAERLFPPGNTPSRPSDLLRLGQRLVSQLETGGAAHLREDATCRIELPVFVDGIRGKVQRLQSALMEVSGAEAAANRARTARDRESCRLRRTQSGVAGLFRALEDLAA